VQQKLFLGHIVLVTVPEEKDRAVRGSKDARFYHEAILKASLGVPISIVSQSTFGRCSDQKEVS
jgi:hypothetical protein